MASVEWCWRHGAEMRWVHQTWQCAICRFKLGCCEGEPSHPLPMPAPSGRSPASPPTGGT